MTDRSKQIPFSVPKLSKSYFWQKIGAVLISLFVPLAIEFCIVGLAYFGGEAHMIQLANLIDSNFQANLGICFVVSILVFIGTFRYTAKEQKARMSVLGKEIIFSPEKISICVLLIDRTSKSWLSWKRKQIESGNIYLELPWSNILSWKVTYQESESNIYYCYQFTTREQMKTYTMNRKVFFPNEEQFINLLSGHLLYPIVLEDKIRKPKS